MIASITEIFYNVYWNNNAVLLESWRMEQIDHEAEYEEILDVLRNNGGEMDYKTLNETLANKFEGIIALE